VTDQEFFKKGIEPGVWGQRKMKKNVKQNVKLAYVYNFYIFKM